MKNTDLNDILAFVAVGKTGSFTKAAQDLGTPKSYVSRKVSQLEERLKMRLIERTTRSVLLTDAGSQYFSVCEKALSEISEQEKSFDQTQLVPSGRLRITCPVEFGSIITAKIGKKFLLKYPEIQIDVLATNTILDLVRDKIDVAIRPLQLADPSMRSVHVGNLEWGLYASPQWAFANSHLLEKIDSLQVLNVIAFNPTLSGQKKFQLTLYRKDKKKVIEYSPQVIASNLSILMEAAMSDLGIAPLPDVLIHQHIKDKKLVRIFHDWTYRKETVAAVFINQKNVPTRVRALIDFIKENSLFEDDLKPS